MILRRSNVIPIDQLEEGMIKHIGPKNTAEVKKILAYYRVCRAAANEFGTKLENLDADYSGRGVHNPIHHMEERIKTPRSLAQKMLDKGYDINFAGIKNNIFDIAGLRVVTNYINDIYTVEKNLLAQDDVTLIRRRDYVKNPKPSGYRSLHLVVSVPVFQATGAVEAPVEIQIRSIGMDMWASLEHKLRYKTKTGSNLVAKYAPDLEGYSSQILDIEQHLQLIYTEIGKETEDE